MIITRKLASYKLVSKSIFLFTLKLLQVITNFRKITTIKMIVVGITGTIGAGKGTIVDYLVKNKGFKHFSVRNYLTKILAKNNTPLDRDHMVELANKLRTKNGPDFIIKELYKEALKTNKNCIIESIRTIGEIDFLKENPNFYLFSVDAKPKLRFERITRRASGTDKVSFKKFLEDERREMSSHNPNAQNLSKCITLADYKFDNSGTIKKLHEEVEKVISKIS